ncbi:4Fe-4S dicluster domain-containing protein, partial [Acidobacteriota bacterium]
MDKKALLSLENDIAQCIKCGSCRSVCPLFNLTGRETTVARGRLALLEAGLNDEDLFVKNLAIVLSSCLFCGK